MAMLVQKVDMVLRRTGTITTKSSVRSSRTIILRRWSTPVMVGLSKMLLSIVITRHSSSERFK